MIPVKKIPSKGCFSNRNHDCKQYTTYNTRIENYPDKMIREENLEFLIFQEMDIFQLHDPQDEVFPEKNIPIR